MTEDILELIHDIMHKYRSQQYQALRNGACEITHMDSKVLNYFDRNPQATQTDLAQYSGRDKAQLARLIRNLRERGLLQAETDVNDRRSVRLSPTPQGAALLDTLKKSGRRITARAVSGLDGDERRQLRELLLRVRANLDSEAH